MENGEETVSELKSEVIEEKAEKIEDIIETEENIEVKEDVRKDTINKEQTVKIKKENKKLKWIIPIILIILAMAFMSVGFALINIGNERIIAGVSIDNVNIQGLDKKQVKQVINNKIEEKLNKDIKIKINQEENSILLFQIELEYLAEDAINKAYDVGRNGNIFINNYNILKSKISGTNINMEYKYNEELLNTVISDIKSKIPNGVIQPNYCIEEEELIVTRGTKGLSIDDRTFKKELEKNINLSMISDIILNTFEVEPENINIEQIYEEIHTEAKDAYYTTNPFQIYPEVLGVDFDIEKAKEILSENKEEYIIPLTITKPKITINSIGTEAFPDLLSTFTTRYDASNSSRTTNLKIAVSKLNGVVVMPGETLSYNKTLGKRTAEAGYKDAAGYAGGKVVQMIGGGICQISSTLYDAVVYANLEVVERHNHAFLTSYVGAGKDATVVYGSLDFKFKNSRNYPITIKASANNGIAKIDIYGIKEENEYDVGISTTILNYIPFTIKYENDSSLPEGTEKVTQGGMNGCKSITYKILKQNGKEVSRSVLSTDTYDPMNKYITRGTKSIAVVEPLKPSETPNPIKPQESVIPEEPLTPEEPGNPITPEEQNVTEQPIEQEKPEVENVIQD